MVLGLLAVVWIAVLAPPLLRKGAETRKADSIGDFRRSLVVLQRTGPSVIPPANTRVDHRRPAQSPSYAAPAFAPTYGGMPASARVGRAAATPRARAVRRRRRNVLMTLALTTVVLFAVGAVPGMHVLLALAAVSIVMLGAYVALLVRIRNAAAEREMKLSFLPGAAAYAGAPMLRRSAN